jgi:hypothetical protein
MLANSRLKLKIFKSLFYFVYIGLIRAKTRIKESKAGVPFDLCQGKVSISDKPQFLPFCDGILRLLLDMRT